MNACKGIVIGLTAAAVLRGTAYGEPPTVHIPRVVTPPRLEDYVDGGERRDEARVTGFTQREPGDGDPISQETTAYFSYDDDNLYAILVCRDREPEKIRARLTKREAFWDDDAAGVLLDTFHDRRRAYIFIVNPLGIQIDGVVTEGQDDDYSYDTLWHSKGRLTADGYVVWLAIPLKSLRFPDAPSQTWGIAFGRIIPRTNETAFWPYVTRRLEGFTQQMAILTGLEHISPGRNAQLIPYGAFASARFLDQSAGRYETDQDPRAGLDAKAIWRDAFTVDVALNPDFSQVESDEPQVTINERFEVFFPEKRPFFIENAGFFQTPVNLFFSRRIADPQFGGRLTGKVGGWAMGLLVIDDRAPGRRLAASHPAFGARAGIGVVRAQREFGQQSGVGFLVSSRDFGSGDNRVAAADLRLKLNPNWVFTGQAVASRTRLLDGQALSGPAYAAALRHSGRHFTYTLGYTDRGPAFRSHLGFIPRVDVRQGEQLIAYTWRPQRRKLVAFGPQLFGQVLWDHQGRLQDWTVNPELGFEWTGQTELEISHTEAFERFENVGFRKHSTRLFFGTEWLKWLVWSVSYTRGTNINFVPAGRLDPFLGDATTLRPSITLRPTPRLTYDQTYIYTRLATGAGSLPPGAVAGTSIFANHIVRSRVTYQFTRELSLRGIVDFNGVNPDPSLVSLDRLKRFTTDVLVTYLVNPWTAVYVGYTDDYQNLELAPDGAPRRTAAPTTSVGRQVFLKTSYLVRF